MSFFRKIFTSFFFIFCVSMLNAQTEFGETTKSRIFLGGDFRIAASTYGSLLDLNPFVGYNLNEYLSVAAGPSYIFYSERSPGQVKSFRTSFYGGRTFLRVRPFPERLPSIYFQGETQFINSLIFRYDPVLMTDIRERVWNPYVMAGIGFRQQASDNAFFTFTILFNFLEEDGSVFSYLNGSPLSYRIGFMLGLF